VITTGNFPSSLDDLHVVGDLLLDGTFTVFFLARMRATVLFLARIRATVLFLARIRATVLFLTRIERVYVPNSLDDLHVVGDLLLDGTFTVFFLT